MEICVSIENTISIRFRKCNQILMYYKVLWRSIFFVLADDPAILMNNTTFSNVVSNALIIIKNV